MSDSTLARCLDHIREAARKLHARSSAERLLPEWHALAFAEQVEVLAREGRRALAVGDPAQAVALLDRAEAALDLFRLVSDQRIPAGSVAEYVDIVDAVAWEAWLALRARARSLCAELPPGRPPLGLVAGGAGWLALPRGAVAPLPAGTAHPVPVPLVLAPACGRACPWLLALVLHEVAHHVDVDLGLSRRLTRPLRGALAGRAGRWSGWLGELLADLVAGRLAGPVYARVLAEALGPLGGREADTEHPPLELRMLVADEAAAARLDPDHPLRVVLGTLLSAPVLGGGDLRSLLDGLGPGSLPWCALPGRLQDAGADDLARAARLLPRPAWKPEPALSLFLRDVALHQAAPHCEADAPKASPAALLARFDEAALVGATHGRLVEALDLAWARRGGRPWRRIDVVAQDDEGLRRMGEPSPARRDEVLAVLRHRLPGRCLRGSLRLAPAFDLFGSAWHDPATGERRVHASPRLWGRAPRDCPAVDYVEAPGEPTPEVAAWLRGIENLLASCVTLFEWESPEAAPAPGPRPLVALSVSETDALGLATEGVREAAVLLARGLWAGGYDVGWGGVELPGSITGDLCAAAAEVDPTRLRLFPPWTGAPPAGRRERAGAVRLARERLTACCVARVVLGGKVTGFSGTLPGVVEEVVLALRAARPVFLLGGFGGATRLLVDLLEGGDAAVLCASGLAELDADYADRLVALSGTPGGGGPRRGPTRASREGPGRPAQRG